MTQPTQEPQEAPSSAGMMRLSAFRIEAMRTMFAGLGVRGAIDCYLIGLFGEAGEVVDLLKKVLYHGHPLADVRAKIAEEAGDCLWYTVALATTLGVGFADIECDSLTRRAFLVSYAQFGSHDDALKHVALTLMRDVARVDRAIDLDERTEELRRDVDVQMFTLVYTLALVGIAIGVPLADIARGNIAKRRRRYPHGFTHFASLNRQE